MKIKLGLSNNKVYIRYLAKYLLGVFIFSSLALFFSYTFFIDQYRDDFLVSNYEKYNNSREVIDNEILRMHQIASQVNDNILLSPSYLKSSYAYYTAVNEIRKYKVASSYLEDIFLFYNDPSIQQVVASLCTYPKEEFYSRDRLKIPMPTEWSDANPQIYFTEGVSSQGERNEYFVYVYPLKISSNPRNGTLIFVINVQPMLDVMMSSFENVNNSVGIIDSEGKIIGFKSNYDSKIKEDDVLMALNTSPKEKNVFNATIKNEKFTVIKLPSDKHNWTYITVLKQKQLEASMVKLREVIIYGVILLLLLSIPLSWLMARNDYKPIRNLVEAIKKPNNEFNVKETENELVFLQHAFEYYESEKTQLKSSLKAQENMIEDNIIISLLRGNLDIKEAKYQMDIFGTPLDGKCFRLMLILIDDFANFKNSVDAKEQAHIKQEIIDGIRNLMGTQVMLHCTEDVEGNKFIVLLNYDEPVSKEGIKESCQKFMSFCSETFGMSISVVMGEQFINIEDIKQQRSKVYELAKYRLVQGWNSLIEPGCMNEIGYFTNLLPEENLYLLYKQGNLSSILKHVDTAMKMCGNGLFSPDTCKIEYYKVLRVMNLVNEETLSNDKCHNMIIDALKSEPETIEQMHLILTDLSKALCNVVVMQKESHNTILLDKITSFMQLNYTNSNMNLEMISSEINISPSYLSRYFKDQTGKSITAYLETMRMTAAKQLLENTDLQVKEIVQRVGYGDVNNFIRKFRTLFGMTPINYRKLFFKQV